MSIKFCRGDVFAASEPVDLAHGCNCQGYMGAGIAAEFSRRWPEMYKLYKGYCAAYNVAAVSPLGKLLAWDDPERRLAFHPIADRRIYNLFTQVSGGPCADPYAIVSSVNEMLQTAQEFRPNAKIMMPLVGAGIGGLSVQVAEAAIILGYAMANPKNVDLYVIDEYVQGLDPLLSA